MEKIRFKFNSLSIKYKIFLYLIGFCAVLLFLLWIFQVVFMARMYGNIRMSQMNMCAQKIEHIIRNNENFEDISAIAEENEACVMILQPNGVMAYSVETARNCKIHKMHFMDILNIAIKTSEYGGEIKGIYSSNCPFRPDEIITNSKPVLDTDDLLQRNKRWGECAGIYSSQYSVKPC